MKKKVRQQRPEPAGVDLARAGRAFLVLIVVIAALLRFYDLNATPPGLYHDEGMNGSNALEALESGNFFKVFYPENNGREGLYINAVVLSVGIFGNRPAAVRIPSAVFGVLTVVGVYFLAAELFSAPVGLFAAFFLATSFWHLVLSRLSVRAISAPCFLVWAVYFLVAAIGRLRQGKPYGGMMLTAGILYGLGFHTYIPYRASPVLIAGLFVYWFLQSRREGWTAAFGRACGVFLAAAFAAASPLLIYFMRHPAAFAERTSQVSVFATQHPVLEIANNALKTALMFFTAGDTNWRHNYAGRAELFWPVGLLFAGGVAMAVAVVYAGMRRQRSGAFPYGLLLGWIVLGALPAVFSNEGTPHALRTILVIPPVFILAAAAAGRVYDYLAPRINAALRLSALAVSFLLLCYEPYHTYFDSWAHDPNVGTYFEKDLSQFAARINELPRETPKFVVMADPGGMANGIPVAVQTIAFLTGSYTKKGQEAINIHYAVPATGFKPASGRTFCQQVASSVTDAAVFCLD